MICPMTFCQLARRIAVVVFIALAAVEAIVAAHCSNGHRAPHLIVALVFAFVAAIAFLIDWSLERQ